MELIATWKWCVAGAGFAGPWLPFAASTLANPAAPRPLFSGLVSLFSQAGGAPLHLPAVALSAATSQVSRPGQGSRECAHE